MKTFSNIIFHDNYHNNYNNIEIGAEKALFRALKTKGNTPKYGLIYHSSFIGRASSKNKGRISRYLANKCAIASRIDSFIEEPTKAYGEQLRDQVEERLKFYDTGKQCVVYKLHVYRSAECWMIYLKVQMNELLEDGSMNKWMDAQMRGMYGWMTV